MKNLYDYQVEEFNSEGLLAIEGGADHPIGSAIGSVFGFVAGSLLGLAVNVAKVGTQTGFPG